MRFLQLTAAAAVLALACALAPAQAKNRVALVIGNARYPSLSSADQLQKAVNDARAVGGALRKIGFDVVEGENLGRQALIDKLDSVTRKLAPGDTAFFFFSGHGVAIDGVNYILPADIPQIADSQGTRLKGAALAEEYITAELMHAGAQVAVIVLDACRNNPFAHGGTKGIGGEKGLAPKEPPGGVFAFYAAGRGESALDRLYDNDSDPNSVFTRALLPALTRPGLDLPAMAVEVREQVTRMARQVKHDQRPAYYDGTSGGRIFLAGLPPANGEEGSGAPALSNGSASDEIAWSIMRDTRDAGQLRRFIAQYPSSPHRREAAERLTAVEHATAGQPAAVAPSSAPGSFWSGLFGRPAAPQPSGRPVDPGPDVAVASPPMTPAATSAAAPPVPAPAPCSGPVAVSFPSQCAAPLTASQERGLKPKDRFKECADCPEMVVVPAGRFTMGSPETEKDRSANEGPQHVVTVGKPFAVGKLHVTVDQFAAFVRETGYAASSECYTIEDGKYEKRPNRSWRNPGFVKDGSHPIVCITWDDAAAYIDWVSKKTDKPYRMLSEAEFEYAARGQTSAGRYPRFWFGDDERDLCRNANGADQKAKDSISEASGWTVASCNDGFVRTSPAGRYAANAFGLYDMAGNAGAWTADCYHDSYKGAPSDGSAWTTSCGDNARVVRGGSWYSSPKFLRAAFRLGSAGPNCIISFRLARTLTP